MAATAGSVLLDQDDVVTVAMVGALADALALLPSDSPKHVTRGDHDTVRVRARAQSAVAETWPQNALPLTDEIMRAMLEQVEAARSSMNVMLDEHLADASSDSDGEFGGGGGRSLAAEPRAAHWLLAAESAAAQPRDRDRTVFGDRTRPPSAALTPSLDDTTRALARPRLALDLGLDSSDGGFSD